MQDQTTLFQLPMLTLDITNSWEFTDPYGVVTDPQKDTPIEWLRECPHAETECAANECRDCGTPIGWALVSEFLARERGRADEGE
ncbi:MAG TPA: hypothetical protein VH084_28350 [Mycobacterium sp.]|nr:hypothetical protein [Mycobacterium sp.]